MHKMETETKTVQAYLERMLSKDDHKYEKLRPEGGYYSLDSAYDPFSVFDPVVTAFYLPVSFRSAEIHMRIIGDERKICDNDTRKICWWQTIYRRDIPDLNCLLQESKQIPSTASSDVKFVMFNGVEYVRWMPSKRFFCGHIEFDVIDDTDDPKPIIYKSCGALSVVDRENGDIRHDWIVPVDDKIPSDPNMEIHFDQQDIYDKLEILYTVPKTKAAPQRLKIPILSSNKWRPQSLKS